MDKLTLNVPDAAKVLGISERKLRDLIARGEFPPAVRIGGRVLVSTRALAEWIDSQTKIVA